MTDIHIHLCSSMTEINEDDWNILTDPNDPFSHHSFLSTLENSQSVHPHTGWLPLHLLLKNDQQELVGATPLYLKSHSYGEYIFDWSWADASERSGIAYYPKLSSAIPFTPATGKRFLMQHHPIDLSQALEDGLQSVMEHTQSHSHHVLFCNEQELDLLSERYIRRLSFQFHWTNPNVEYFEQWLDLFRSKDRKKVRSERKKAQMSVDKIYWLQGQELTSDHIETIWAFYNDTCSRKWGQPYLKKEFFYELNQSLSDLTWICFAEKNNQIVASSLCFQRGKHLYGRYWGCLTELNCLHFELCYHQPIELCIQKKWTRFEAGAQGAHKLKRGLLPSPTYSLHHLKFSDLHNGVAEYIKQENAQIKEQMNKFQSHAPLKKEHLKPLKWLI
ncbi:MAG: GNAT family N-acetyltransferase [Proteobacteria bacterium]|nr:GNAT family N-acetyltransferase [Pseudomonadota bacterium]